MIRFRVLIPFPALQKPSSIIAPLAPWHRGMINGWRCVRTSKELWRPLPVRFRFDSSVWSIINRVAGAGYENGVIFPRNFHALLPHKYTHTHTSAHIEHKLFPFSLVGGTWAGKFSRWNPFSFRKEKQWPGKRQDKEEGVVGESLK